MGRMKQTAITFELIKNNANELMRQARLAEEGKLDPSELIWAIQEMANKILQTIEEENM